MSIDALVIGAGPAGLAAAARLARWCEAVTVVEWRPRDRRRRAGEHLPPATLRTLTARGLQDLLADRRHGESSGVRSVWGGQDAADRNYVFALPGRGLNLERAVFDDALAAHAEQAGARVLFGAPLTRLTPIGAGYAATIGGPDGPRRLTAGNVVDASGRRAVAARRLGASTMRVDRLVGLIGVIKGAAPLEDPGRLRIETAEDG